MTPSQEIPGALRDLFAPDAELELTATFRAADGWRPWKPSFVDIDRLPNRYRLRGLAIDHDVSAVRVRQVGREPVTVMLWELLADDPWLAESSRGQEWFARYAPARRAE